MIRYFRFVCWILSHRYVWFLRSRPVELPLRIYEASPGGGKTLGACRDVIQYMRLGVRVASNLYVRDAYTGQEAIPCRTWAEMLRLSVQAVRDDEPILFFFDELHNICDARNWQATPGWWREMMSQHRHLGIGIIATTQALNQVEVRMRTLCKELIRCKRVELAPWLRAGMGRLAACACFGVGAVYGVRGHVWAVPLILLGALFWFVVPVLLDRLPLYREIRLDGSLIDTPGASWESNQQRRVWMPWYAYHSYSTSEIIRGDDLKSYNDEELAAEIAEITAEMAGLLEVTGLPAFADICPQAAA